MMQRVGVAKLRDGHKRVVRGAEVLLLDMTERSDTPSHGEALNRIGPPVMVPKIPNNMVFSSDPIHLNVRGHETLARMLAPSVSALLVREAGDSQDP